MKILITGGTGFTGSNIALALENEEHDIVVVDKDISKANANLKGFSGEIREADVSTPEFWNNLTEEFDSINHQAACVDTTVMDEVFMMNQNVEAFKMLLDWAKKNEVDVVYASSAETYGNSPAPQKVGEGEEPLNIYGKSKLMMDQITREQIGESPIKIIGLRYFNVYGPGETHKGKMASMIYQLAQQMKAGNHPRIFTDGEQKRDQIYVGDVAQANILSHEAPIAASGIYNVGTGKASTFNQIVEELNEVLGTDLPPDYFENPYDFYQEFTEADISDTKKILGYEPKYSLKEGIGAYFCNSELRMQN